jgi:cation:H+ antiporter
MFLAIFLFVIGLTVLVAGAEFLVRGASSLAQKWGVPAIVIGLTIVAFGTSMPELVVNLFSAFRGATDIAIGNIIGSNTANILLILGISAMIYPLSVKKNTTWKEIPFALLAVVLVFIMGNDSLFDGVDFNALTRTDGLALIAFFGIFMFYIVSLARQEETSEEKARVYSTWLSTLFTVGGLAALFVGGKILVDNAVILARLAGMSEALIGLTIVAVGTSLPELATSVVAVIRKQNDIAVGNIVGSNIFNVFWILGLTGTILPLPFNSIINFDVLVSITTTLLLFLFLFVGTRRKLDRWQGALFILLYAVYVAYLVYRG